jgi:hypothetical protein
MQLTWYYEETLDGCCGIGVLSNLRVLPGRKKALRPLMKRMGWTSLIATTVETQREAAAELERMGFTPIGKFVSRTTRSTITTWMYTQKGALRD